MGRPETGAQRPRAAAGWRPQSAGRGHLITLRVRREVTVIPGREQPSSHRANSCAQGAEFRRSTLGSLESATRRPIAGECQRFPGDCLSAQSPYFPKGHSRSPTQVPSVPTRHRVLSAVRRRRSIGLEAAVTRVRFQGRSRWARFGHGNAPHRAHRPARPRRHRRTHHLPSSPPPLTRPRAPLRGQP